MASDGEQGFDLDRIVLSPDAGVAFRGIADTATRMDQGEASSHPVEELRVFNLVQRVGSAAGMMLGSYSFSCAVVLRIDRMPSRPPGRRPA